MDQNIVLKKACRCLAQECRSAYQDVYAREGTCETNPEFVYLKQNARVSEILKVLNQLGYVLGDYSYSHHKARSNQQTFVPQRKINTFFHFVHLSQFYLYLQNRNVQTLMNSGPHVPKLRVVHKTVRKGVNQYIVRG